MLTTKKYTADVRRKKSIEKCIGETLRLTIKICSGATWYLYRAKDPKNNNSDCGSTTHPRKNQPTSGQIYAKTKKTKRRNTEFNTWTNNSWERNPYIQNVRSSGAPLACYSADCLHERIVFYVRAFDRFVDHCFPTKMCWKWFQTRLVEVAPTHFKSKSICHMSVMVSMFENNEISNELVSECPGQVSVVSRCPPIP